MPEIRSTVSNLSQAIRFVVQNDFFDGVEIKPGDADRRLVEVIEEPEQLADRDTRVKMEPEADSMPCKQEDA